MKYLIALFILGSCASKTSYYEGKYSKADFDYRVRIGDIHQVKDTFACKRNYKRRDREWEHNVYWNFYDMSLEDVTRYSIHIGRDLSIIPGNYHYKKVTTSDKGYRSQTMTQEQMQLFDKELSFCNRHELLKRMTERTNLRWPKNKIKGKKIITVKIVPKGILEDFKKSHVDYKQMIHEMNLVNKGHTTFSNLLYFCLDDSCKRIWVDRQQSSYPVNIIKRWTARKNKGVRSTINYGLTLDAMGQHFRGHK